MKCFTMKSREVKICVFFKSVLSSRSENTGPVTRDHAKFSQMRSKTSLHFQMPEQV